MLNKEEVGRAVAAYNRNCKGSYSRAHQGDWPRHVGPVDEKNAYRAALEYVRGLLCRPGAKTPEEHAALDAYFGCESDDNWYEWCVGNRMAPEIILYLLSGSCKAPVRHRCTALGVLMVNGRAGSNVYNREGQEAAWAHLGEWLDSLDVHERNKAVEDIDGSIEWANYIENEQVKEDTVRWGKIIWAHHVPPKQYPESDSDSDEE